MKYFLILLTVVFYLPLKAGEPETIKYKNYIGFNAGYTTGFGFTYAYWPGKLGLQVTFLPLKNENNTFISVALTTYYKLYCERNYKSYLFLGNHLVSNKYDSEYNIGFGPGFEVGTIVVFSFRGGIGLYDVTDTFSMLPTFDMGIYYKF
jgi:hypothetical protein